ncbi:MULTISPECIES: hypothetical protein [Aerosakkonema]|uniref:hypothetical protein n=1 Tax=Aerosakkonema TaxID=1246629 RepID=UPI0035B9076F
MNSEWRTKNLHYFLEDFNEYLNELELALLKLAETINDAEVINCLLRHGGSSIRGGAMLFGFSTISKIIVYFNQFLVILRDRPVKTDSQLETLLFKVFEILKQFYCKLSIPVGLSENEEMQFLLKSELIFTEIDLYLMLSLN